MDMCGEIVIYMTFILHSVNIKLAHINGGGEFVGDALHIHGHKKYIENLAVLKLPLNKKNAQNKTKLILLKYAYIFLCEISIIKRRPL